MDLSRGARLKADIVMECTSDIVMVIWKRHSLLLSDADMLVESSPCRDCKMVRHHIACLECSLLRPEEARAFGTVLEGESCHGYCGMCLYKHH